MAQGLQPPVARLCTIRGHGSGGQVLGDQVQSVRWSGEQVLWRSVDASLPPPPARALLVGHRFALGLHLGQVIR